MKHSNLCINPNENNKKEQTNRFYVETFEHEEPIVSVPRLIKKFDTVYIHPNRNFSLRLFLPIRSVDASWGGLVVATNMYVNGIKYSLGNSGHSANVTVKDKIPFGTYDNTKIIDLVSDRIIKEGEGANVKIEFYASTISGFAIINTNLRINDAIGIVENRGTVLDWASTQNFATCMIQELTR